MGEVMLLIRPELLFHEYDLATQPCIESGPSDDHKNAEKHHAGTESFARLAGIHCAATCHLHSALIQSQWKQHSFWFEERNK